MAAADGGSSFSLDVVRRLDDRVDALQSILLVAPTPPSSGRATPAESKTFSTAFKATSPSFRSPSKGLKKVKGPRKALPLSDRSASVSLASESKLLSEIREWKTRAASLQSGIALGTSPGAAAPPPPSASASELSPAIYTTSDAHQQLLLSLLRLNNSAYGLVLDSLFKDAHAIGEQAEEWAAIDEEWTSAASYLLKTFPARVWRLLQASLHVVDEQLSMATRSLSSSSSSSSPSGQAPRPRSISLDKRTLIQLWRTLRDSPLFVVQSLFPLALEGKDTLGVSLDLSSGGEQAGASSESSKKRSKKRSIYSLHSAQAFSPLNLTRHEARSKQAALLEERDEIAKRLGKLVQAHERGLAKMDEARNKDGEAEAEDEATKAIELLLRQAHGELKIMGKALSDEADDDDDEREEDEAEADDAPSESADLFELASSLETLLSKVMPSRKSRSSTLLSPAPLGLGPPPLLLRLWPTLVFGPFVLLISGRLVLKNWDTLLQRLGDAKETVKGLVINWIYEPGIRLLDTLRRGDEEQSMIMSKESLNSDLKSLERMVVSFAADNQGVSGAALEGIAAKVREGDLTPVLRVYEDELRSPFKSAVTGSLVRSLLIQVQKAKVDLEVAMSGIDRLLKSQQLLFGAVGIAPAMALLYFGLGWARKTLLGAAGARTHGSVRRAKLRAWEALRRVDRLLAEVPSSDASTGLPPLTRGLLLLDLSLLRSVAPLILAPAVKGSRDGAAAKRLRSQFLMDARDLESAGSGRCSPASSLGSKAKAKAKGGGAVGGVGDVGLGWHARRATVERIWNSWGRLIEIEIA